MWDSPTVLATYQPRDLSPARPRHHGHSSALDYDDSEVLASAASVGGAAAARSSVPREPSRSVVDGDAAAAAADRLLQRRRDADTRLEVKRQQRAAAELAEVTGAPTINARSAKLATPAIPAHVRLSQPRRPLSELATVNATADDREADTVVPVPKINEASHTRRPRGADGFHQWDKERRARQAARERDHDSARKSVFTGTPCLNPKSRELAARRRVDAGVVDAPVEDGLLAWEATRRRRQDEAAAMRDEELRYGAPSGVSGDVDISTGTTSTRGRGGGLDARNAANRLYDDFGTREAERRRRDMESDLISCIDPITGQVLFHPATTQAPQYAHVGPRARGTLTSPTRRAAPAHADGTAEEHRPQISEYSRLLAELRRERDAAVTEDGSVEPTHERLSQPKSVAVNLKMPPSSFTPRVDSRSRAMDARRSATPTQAHTSASGWETRQQSRRGSDWGRQDQPLMAREEQLLEKQRQYDAHRARLASQKATNELAACTFTPRTNRRATTPPASSSRATASTARGDGASQRAPDPRNARQTDSDGFVERQRRWDMRRQKRLESQRAADAARVDPECTFAPLTTAW